MKIRLLNNTLLFLLFFTEASFSIIPEFICKNPVILSKRKSECSNYTTCSQILESILSHKSYEIKKGQKPQGSDGYISIKYGIGHNGFESDEKYTIKYFHNTKQHGDNEITQEFNRNTLNYGDITILNINHPSLIAPRMLLVKDLYDNKLFYITRGDKINSSFKEKSKCIVKIAIFDYFKAVNLHQYLSTPSFKSIKDDKKKQFFLHAAEKLCAVTRYLHQYSIAHLDIKTDNILISQNKKEDPNKTIIKLIDFSSSRLIDRKTFIKGTHGSMTTVSPEMIKTHSYDINTDLWSLGATFFEMIIRIPIYKFIWLSAVNGKLHPTEENKDIIYKISQYKKNDLIAETAYGLCIEYFSKLKDSDKIALMASEMSEGVSSTVLFTIIAGLTRYTPMTRMPLNEAKRLLMTEKNKKLQPPQLSK